MIVFENVRKRFDRRDALSGVSFSVPTGTVTGLLGPNSCGKTTLVKCLLSLVLPDAGRVTVDGQAVASDAAYRAHVGYMPQAPSFPESLRVREIVRLLEEVRQSPAARRDELRERLELDAAWEKPFGILSGGAKQRVGAMAALMFDAPTLVLDEPTASLDPLASLLMRDLIAAERKGGKTILLVSHHLAEVECLADDVALMVEGALVHHGSISRFKADAQVPTLEEAVVAALRRKRDAR